MWKYIHNSHNGPRAPITTHTYAGTQSMSKRDIRNLTKVKEVAKYQSSSCIFLR